MGTNWVLFSDDLLHPIQKNKIYDKMQREKSYKFYRTVYFKVTNFVFKMEKKLPRTNFNNSKTRDFFLFDLFLVVLCKLSSFSHWIFWYILFFNLIERSKGSKNGTNMADPLFFPSFCMSSFVIFIWNLSKRVSSPSHI